jgi:hypothetical protein
MRRDHARPACPAPEQAAEQRGVGPPGRASYVRGAVAGEAGLDAGEGRHTHDGLVLALVYLALERHLAQVEDVREQRP